VDDVWRPRVAAAGIIERAGRFLLIEEESNGRAVFNQPAGHWEPGESLVDCCAREVLEETAHPFRPTALVGIYRWQFGTAADGTFLRFAFAGEAGEPDPARRLDREIIRTVWMTPEEVRACAPRHRSPLVLRCIEDYLAGRRYPLDVITHID